MTSLLSSYIQSTAGDEAFAAPYKSDTSKLQSVGDFLLKEVSLFAYNGKKYDITNVQGGINIYEDLFNNTVTGDIFMCDSNDLPHNMPLIGQERLRIVFTRPEIGDKKDEVIPDTVYEFRIYKIESRQRLQEKTQLYTLHFTSQEFLTNSYTRLSLPFKGMPYSKMVELAFAELKSSKPLVVEATKYDHEFVVPMYTPLQFINAVAARSISAEGNGGGYIFFETKDNFQFTSFGKLLSQEPVETYGYQWFHHNFIGENQETKIDYDKLLRTIETFGHSYGFNVLSALSQGMYSSRLCTYDPVRAIYEETDFDYGSQFGEFKHTDTVPVHTNDFDCYGKPLAVLNLSFTNKDHDTVDWISSKEPAFPTKIEESLLQWHSLLQQLRANRIKVTLPGDPRRKVGEVIDFALPQGIGNVSDEIREELDEYLKGKYLICSIAHRINRERYAIHAELIKDSFVSEIKHVDPNTLLPNTYGAK